MTIAPQRSYLPVSGHYDEMALPSGELRPHWQRLMGALDALGGDELVQRWKTAQRLIQEHGVTYNVYGDPRGIDRPWQLDAIPLLISPEEWASIEQAISQRATLLNALLADLYGPQRLLRENLLPPELVFGNPGFLRPCRGIAVPSGVHLQVYAADLARSPDGQWWVIADRTQAPAGAGYALENRIVISRTLPELFEDFHVRRLAPYFQAYRDALVALAPRRRDNPRVVLLTPGPYNETYFEHAYLARYLGLTLVEGADLTVRHEHVYLKTLSGLLPVDVILRRQDDVYCDPLELYGESALGVPGLVQAVRVGNVAIANALGSGVIETAAIMAFLPGLCRQLLGEELRMPSLATWWCGQERERDYVLANLEHLVLKPAVPRRFREVIFGSDLDAAGRERVLVELAAAPHELVAQERVALSTAPTADGAATTPRHLVVRVYAVASYGSNGAEPRWVLMPGGLTRVSPRSDSLVVSNQRGGGSKDTWVLSDTPVPYVTLMDDRARAVEVSRGSFALTSRLADNLFWLGRLNERVEAGVRLFRTTLRRLSEERLRAADAPVSEMVALLARMGRIAAAERSDPAGAGATSAVAAAQPPTAVARTLDGLFSMDDSLESVRSDVRKLQRLAFLLRDRMSSDAWRALQRVEQDFVEPMVHPALRVTASIDLLDRALLMVSAFSGLMMESTTRGLGWQFLDVGRRLERAVQLVAFLRAALTDELPRSSERLQDVLEVADSAMTYRSRYQAYVQLPLVLDLLLVDEANPRGLSFQLVRLVDRFSTLAKAPTDQARALLTRVRECRVDDLSAVSHDEGGAVRRIQLEALLDEMAVALPALSDALDRAYLSHAVARRQRPEPVRIKL